MGLEPVKMKDTDRYKVIQEFCEDRARFVQAVTNESSPYRSANGEIRD